MIILDHTTLCRVERKWCTTRKVELVRLHTQGHKKVGWRDEDQNLLGEGLLRKSKANWPGRAGKYLKRLHETESVGQTAWKPYATTGAMRHDDDDFFSQIHPFCHCMHFCPDIGDAKSIRKKITKIVSKGNQLSITLVRTVPITASSNGKNK